MPQGFYTGATLATAMATALDACDFPTASKPFSVSYDDTTGLFSITPANGNAKVLVTNSTVNIRWVSTLAPLIGFSVNSAMTTPVVSDTPLVGVGKTMSYLSASGSSSQDVMSTDVVAMTLDNQLLVTASYADADGAESSSSSSASLDVETGVVAYEVVYKILDA